MTYRSDLNNTAARLRLGGEPKEGNMATRTKKTPKKKKAEAAKKKKKLPVDLDEEFIERIKDAVVYLQRGPEPQASIRSFVQEACTVKLKSIKKKHGPIPKREAAPRQGRPMS